MKKYYITDVNYGNKHGIANTFHPLLLLFNKKVIHKDADKILELLMSKGVDISIRSRVSCSTPLHLVASSTDITGLNCVKILLENGASKNIMGFTPIKYASSLALPMFISIQRPLNNNYLIDFIVNKKYDDIHKCIKYSQFDVDCIFDALIFIITNYSDEDRELKLSIFTKAGVNIRDFDDEFA